MKNYTAICEAYDIDKEKNKKLWNKENIAAAALTGLGAAGAGTVVGLANHFDNRSFIKDIEDENAWISDYNKKHSPANPDWIDMAKRMRQDRMWPKGVSRYDGSDFYDNEGRKIVPKNEFDKTNQVSKNSISRDEEIIRDNNKEAALIGLGISLSAASGLWSLKLRDKRQKIIFNKVVEKFPTPSSMIDFCIKRGLDPNGLSPDSNNDEYCHWIYKNVVKKGSWLRSIVNFFGGLAGIGTIINGVKLKNAEEDTPELIVSKNLNMNPTIKMWNQKINS